MPKSRSRTKPANRKNKQRQSWINDKPARKAKRRWGIPISIIGVLGIIALTALIVLHRTSPPPISQSATSQIATNPPNVGSQAPNGTLITNTGKVVSVNSFRGQTNLLWFVTTWCSSCQAGTQVISQRLGELTQHGVHVTEVELYHDLGQSGPNISQFGQALAGVNYSSPAWTWATSSFDLSRTYDPHAYLDIYFLINPQGKIVYENSSPAASFDALKSAIDQEATLTS